MFLSVVAGCTNNDTSTSASIFHSSGLHNDISSLKQIDGKRIGVLSGSAGDIAARKNFSRSIFQVMSASADAALAVQQGKSDAFIYDKSVLLNIVAKNPDLHILDEPVAKLEVAAALHKDNTQLLSEINQVLISLKREGVLQNLRKKWIDSPSMKTPQLPPLSNNQKRGVLRMGTCATIEPFSFQANGIITGLDIEIARLIGERLGRHIKIIDMNFEALIPALQSNKIEFALSNFNVTDERKKLINFSVPYIENDISALVRKSSQQNTVQHKLSSQKSAPGKFSSVDDLKESRIGVLLGSVHDAYARKDFPKATILQYKSPSDMVLAVKSGKVDAGIFSHDELTLLFRHHNDLAFVGQSLFATQIGMGFNLDNKELCDSFNRFMNEIRQNGKNDEMILRWMKNGDTVMPEIKNAANHGTLKVGIVSDAGLPFIAVKDNVLTGYNIELVERFGAFLGKRIVYADLEFGSMIAALSSKKIDMIDASLSITAERQKRVAFSEPYYSENARMFALKKNIVFDGADEEIIKGSGLSQFLDGIVKSFKSNIIQEHRYLLIIDGLKTTVVISLLASISGTLLGALVCTMRMSQQLLLKYLSKLFISILRGTPVLVFLMLIYYVVFASVNIDPVLVAVIAFAMNFAAYVAEIFRSGIETIDKGQSEAGIAMGFSKFSTFIYIIMPQMVQRVFPVYKGEFISLVKMTSIVGYIAVQDLTKAGDIIRSRTFDAFFPLIMVAILYFFVSWVFMLLLGYLEKSIVSNSTYHKSSMGV
ncbi:MAG: ABC transporter substrate-binding protein/permease [Chlorobium sp.]